MKVKELFSYIDTVKPNPFKPEIKVVWLNEIEGAIQTQIMLLSLEDVIEYDAVADLETELLAEAPHEKVYYAYLQAMIDFENGEYQNYANSMQMFNKFWNEYAAWYALNIDPASGECGFKGYYLSAYAIAVKHGYEGDEEGWAKVLIDAAANAKAAAESADEAKHSATVAESYAAASAKSAEVAKEAANKYPIILGGIWFVWSTSTGGYVSTNIDASGEDGEDGTVWYSGAEVSNENGDATFVDGAKPGDFYLNTSTGQIFKLMSTMVWVEQMRIGGGTSFKTDDTLKFENGVLSVNTADELEADNTLPITSAAVATTVGNIEILLKTI